MNCPRCGIELMTGRAGALTAHGCGRCGGVWLDNATSTQVVQGLTEQALAGFRAHTARTEQASATLADEAQTRACPDCGEPLHRQHVERAQLDVDICAQHGTFFDRGEVEKIVQAMKPTAAEKVRARRHHGIPGLPAEILVERPQLFSLSDMLLAMHQEKTDITVSWGAWTYKLGNVDEL